MTDQRVINSKGLVATAHPLRRRLLTPLDVDGPATPSVPAERTAPAVANIGHHLGRERGPVFVFAHAVPGTP